MEPEVLAQHQVEEFRKLVTRYETWKTNNLSHLTAKYANKIDDITRTSIGQTDVILGVILNDIYKILEQR